ncbi:alpha 1,2-mannosyltransferase [Microdochium nivale]|nr:alpha 1,2-mannosyltransferase [Microdochium nivale]
MGSKPGHRRRSGGGSGSHRPSRISGLHCTSTARVATNTSARVVASVKASHKVPDDNLAVIGAQGDVSSASIVAHEDHHEHHAQSPIWALLARKFRRLPFGKIFVLLTLFLIFLGSAWIFYDEYTSVIQPTPRPYPGPDPYALDEYLPPMPELPGYPYVSQDTSGVNEIQWLRDNTYLEPDKLSSRAVRSLIATRPKATFLSLVRNSELEDMISSIMQVESRFNEIAIHRYDWVFFNNEHFTDHFKATVVNATSGRCFFETIPKKHWSTPEWIDKSRFGVGREFLGSIGVGKSWLESYHHMCRWNSGLFALEDRLRQYDFYWRVEPGVKFTCNINYDVFRFMRDNRKAYGFNMAILDDARSFPSLWDRTKTFQTFHPEMTNEAADMEWLMHTSEEMGTSRVPAGLEGSGGGKEYNNCQFYSNFEIGSLAFFRGEKHQAYFNHLDRAGGFYYERYGDAPVHTLSVSMFLPKSSIWFFRDIGYAHGLCQQCPPHHDDMMVDPEMQRADDTTHAPAEYHRLKQMVARGFKRQDSIPGLQCGCTVTTLDENFTKLVPFESKQRKPFVSCIRRWLARLYLLPNITKRPLAEVIAAGGDGYGGWRIQGIESNPFKEGTLE